MGIYFADLNWLQLQEVIKKNTVVMVPVGTIEEHGRHLPVSTDAVIATEIARRTAEKIKEDVPILVMPTVWTGYSAKEMSRWPGTLRIRPEVLTDLIVDLLGSLAEMGFKKMVLLDCHGHHSGILNVAVRKTSDQFGIYPAIVSPGAFSAEVFAKIRRSETGGAIHGGEWETSLMLYFNQPVNMAEATKDDIMRYHSKFILGDGFVGGKGVFWSTWGIQKSQTGIYGDPTCATRETGEKCCQAIIDNLTEFLKEYYGKDI